MSNNKEPADLLDRIISLKNKIGTNLLQEKLDELDLQYDKDYIFNTVVEEVCAVVGIEKKNLLDNAIRSRDDKRQMSINYTCLILHELCGFTLKKITLIFNIHISNASRRICNMRKMNPNNKVDAKYVEEFNLITANLKSKNIFKSNT